MAVTIVSDNYYCYFMDNHEALRSGIRTRVINHIGNGIIELSSQPGISIDYNYRKLKNYTYARIGKIKKNVYWANPRKEIINKDWFLILNDHREKKLYVFFIPKGSLTLNQFDTRVNNKVEKLIIEIPDAYPQINPTTNQLIFNNPKKSVPGSNPIDFGNYLQYIIKYNLY